VSPEDGNLTIPIADDYAQKTCNMFVQLQRFCPKANSSGRERSGGSGKRVLAMPTCCPPYAHSFATESSKGSTKRVFNRVRWLYGPYGKCQMLRLEYRHICWSTDAYRVGHWRFWSETSAPTWVNQSRITWPTELHVQHGQEVYTHNYNLLSRDKRFDDNDASPRQRRRRQAV